jgi:hypothetical protein
MSKTQNQKGTLNTWQWLDFHCCFRNINIYIYKQEILIIILYEKNNGTKT